jgi:hypothetical protein
VENGAEHLAGEAPGNFLVHGLEQRGTCARRPLP